MKGPLSNAPGPPPRPEPAAKLMMMLILLMLRMVIVMQVIAAAAAPSSEEGASQTEMIGESVARHGVVGTVKLVVVVVAGVRARTQTLSEAKALGLGSPQYPGRVCMCRVVATASQTRQVLDVLVHARSQYIIRHVRTNGVGERGGLLF